MMILRTLAALSISILFLVGMILLFWAFYRLMDGDTDVT